jgi:hypothetical protein
LNLNSRKHSLEKHGGFKRRIENFAHSGEAVTILDTTKGGGFFVSAYQKELRSTVGFGIVYVLLGHTGLWAIALGTDNSIRILGLPIHYFIAITLGSFGVLFWSLIWCRYANRLEDEIEAENAAYAKRAETAHNETDLQGVEPHADTMPEAAK